MGIWDCAAPITPELDRRARHSPTLCAFYFLRVPQEEAMMIEQFGAAYRAYMERTGRILPKWNS